MQLSIIILATNKVEKMWQRNGTDYILAKVYGTNITDSDIKSLGHGEWLTDQVYRLLITFN